MRESDSEVWGMGTTAGVLPGLPGGVMPRLVWASQVSSTGPPLTTLTSCFLVTSPLTLKAWVGLSNWWSLGHMPMLLGKWATEL